MPDEARLREQAREAMRSGRLPAKPQDRMWGGPGLGVRCVVCDLAITKDQLEMQIEFGHDGAKPGIDAYHLHVRCFAAWEFERNKPARS